jgi:beta-1,4-N-acetylglucosaminyltransferase
MDKSISKSTCFITVGTTEFDALIKVIDTTECLNQLRKMGFHTLIIQYGRGKYIPLPGERHGIQIISYTFKPTLKEDMEKADLIISHAGAGSVMESLRLRKPLVVVVNNALMDNHQIELAEALGRDGYLFYSESPDDLIPLLQMNDIKCKPYPDRNETLFPTFMNSVIQGQSNTEKITSCTIS